VAVWSQFGNPREPRQSLPAATYTVIAAAVALSRTFR